MQTRNPRNLYVNKRLKTTATTDGCTYLDKHTTIHKGKADVSTHSYAYSQLLGKGRYNESKERMTHAIPAVCIVEMNPQIMADIAILAMILLLEGARAPSTPIWIPRDPRLANPQSA